MLQELVDDEVDQGDHFEVFPWNRNFETGIAKIDEQHRTLVNLLNKLAKTLVNNHFVEVNAAFKELTDYASQHFSDEEEVWAKYFKNDQWLTSHQISHASFLPKVVEIKNEGDGKALSDIVEHIIKFLIRWLAFHIIDSDKRLAIVVDAVDAGKTLTEAKEIAEVKMSGAMRVLIETILTMYDSLSSRALELMRERTARIKAEQQLKQANKLLEELSITDSLTGLFNRRYFETILQSELRRASRQNSILGFMLIDIDHFKAYNDTYGHLQGDTALQILGGRMIEMCRRPGDLVFRLGGEEFCILMTDQTENSTRSFSEIIRKGVEELQLSHKNSPIGHHLTVSIGAVSRVPEPSDTPEDFYHQADQQLYQAKANGRNQVSIVLR